MMKAQKMKVCANCKNHYIDGDTYCRYCGAKLGTPDFIPENFACIYGPPPVEREHKCKQCGYSWKTHLMIDDEDYCQKKKKKTQVISPEEPWI